MRIATWNVNSLKARLEKVGWWLDRTEPDVLLMQETKLSDEAAPRDEFARRGYDLAHHGEGRWNGVAIASRIGIGDMIENFGVANEPRAEARMISALCQGVRVVSIYAPNGRVVGSEFFLAKLAWYARLSAWLQETRQPSEALVIGGDFNVAPADEDVWDPALCNGGTHVSPEERAAFRAFLDWGLVDAYRVGHPEPDRYTWWDYRAGHFQKNYGMRIDHLLVSRPLVGRIVATEIDREARKGKPIPSDHAPLLLDLDQPGRSFDPGWKGADERIAARREAASRRG
jgi:exodeoxyribonuclease-3